MKFKVGQCVREGGSLGNISTIIEIRGNIYVVQSERAIGYVTEDYLYPVKEYEQLSLFGGVL